MAAPEPLINTELATKPIDETPISPVGPSRRDSIEKHLLHRPERNNLVESAFLSSLLEPAPAISITPSSGP